jgi:hypothetical protein
MSKETMGKVRQDPEAQQVMPDTASSKSGSEGEGDDLPTPSDDQHRADQGTPSNGSQSEKREEVKEKVETDFSLMERDTINNNTHAHARTRTRTHTHTHTPLSSFKLTYITAKQLRQLYASS